MDRNARLIRLYERVYSRTSLVCALKAVGKVSVLAVALTFISACIYVGVSCSVVECVQFALSAVIPFTVVSVMRALFDFKRPYEVIDFPHFAAMRCERKAGKSFPSRHVFSAFTIGALMLSVSPILGVVVLTLGAFLAVERVLLGIHFTRDVLAGAIVGLLSGIVGILFL